MVIRTFLLTRILSVPAGILLGLLGGGLALSADGPLWARLVIALALLVGAAGIGYRIFDQGIDCDAERAVVKGVFLTRVVERRAIVRLSDDTVPAFEWINAAGRQRVTRIYALFQSSGDLFPVFGAHKGESLARLAFWIQHGTDVPDRDALKNGWL